MFIMKSGLDVNLSNKNINANGVDGGSVTLSLTDMLMATSHSVPEFGSFYLVTAMACIILQVSGVVSDMLYTT